MTTMQAILLAIYLFGFLIAWVQGYKKQVEVMSRKEVRRRATIPGLSVEERLKPLLSSYEHRLFVLIWFVVAFFWLPVGLVLACFALHHFIQYRRAR